MSGKQTGVKSKFSRGPRSRSCYICGRQYMLHSFPIHESQCKAMFEKWESQKPPKERQQCPEDPMNPKSSFNLRKQKMDCTIDSSKQSAAGAAEASDAGRNTFDSTISDNAYTSSGNMMKCRSCGRRFNAVSYAKHSKVCARVFFSRRKEFDSAKHRAMGTEFAQEHYHLSGRRKSKNSGKVGPTRIGQTQSGVNITGSTAATTKNLASTMKIPGVPKWKQDSQKFRQAMKESKLVTRAQKRSTETGVPLYLLLPTNDPSSTSHVSPDAESNPTSNHDELKCPTCDRSFNHKAGERHIPQCKDIINKPVRLKRGSGLPSYSTLGSPGGYLSASKTAAASLPIQVRISGKSESTAGFRMTANLQPKEDKTGCKAAQLLTHTAVLKKREMSVVSSRTKASVPSAPRSADADAYSRIRQQHHHQQQPKQQSQQKTQQIRPTSAETFQDKRNEYLASSMTSNSLSRRKSMELTPHVGGQLSARVNTTNLRNVRQGAFTYAYSGSAAHRRSMRGGSTSSCPSSDYQLGTSNNTSSDNPLLTSSLRIHSL